MNNKSKLVISSLLITIGLFVYLSFHHYALKLGLGGTSLCEISSKINCDAAATSSFAEVAGIPIAIMGGVFNLILLLFVLFYEWTWVEATAYLKTTVRGMLLVSVLVSLISGGFSLFILKVICPFCVATYVFSFINLVLGWSLIQPTSQDFQFTKYFADYKSHIIAMLCIPLFSWAIAGMIQSSYGLDLLKQQIPEMLSIWERGSEYSFDTNTGLSNGTNNPRLTIVEFADFKCPHCRVAAKTLETFLKGRSDVLFVFKPFPLDGNCNPGVTQKGDNSRCQLAAITLCADKLAQNGWLLHHWIFDKQETLFHITDAKTLLPKIQDEFKLDQQKMSDCIDSSEIYENIKRSAQEGVNAQVEGTPTVYINGKKLPGAQYLEVLKAAYQK